MKYLIINDDRGLNVFMFPSFLNHNEMADRVSNQNSKIISAGYVKCEESANNGVPYVNEHGSETLGIKYNAEQLKKDEKLILRQFSLGI